MNRTIFCLLLFLGAIMPTQAANPIALYDLTSAEKAFHDPQRLPDAWDHCHAVATLQGIVNRERPRLFIRAVANAESGNIRLDDWWLGKLRGKGAWLEGRPVEEVP